MRFLHFTLWEEIPSYPDFVVVTIQAEKGLDCPYLECMAAPFPLISDPPESKINGYIQAQKDRRAR